MYVHLCIKTRFIDCGFLSSFIILFFSILLTLSGRKLIHYFIIYLFNIFNILVTIMCGTCDKFDDIQLYVPVPITFKV